MARHSNTGNTFFQSRNYQGPWGSHSQDPGRHYKICPRDIYNYPSPGGHFYQRVVVLDHFMYLCYSILVLSILV